VQVQPLHRSTYAETVTNGARVVKGMAEFDAGTWAKYEANIVQPNREPARPVGAYAAEVRKRRRGVCPVHSA
jgi:hypothetical protein